MELLIGIGVVLSGILWLHYRREYMERQKEKTKASMDRLLSETAAVVYDFLEYGKAVAAATEGNYKGSISARLYVFPGGEMGYSVAMYGSGDLSLLPFERVCELNLSAFVRKYSFYYDQERDSLVYETSVRVKLTGGQVQELEKALFACLQKHPLAVMTSNALIHTRGIR